MFALNVFTVSLSTTLLAGIRLILFFDIIVMGKKEKKLGRDWRENQYAAVTLLVGCPAAA